MERTNQDHVVMAESIRQWRVAYQHASRLVVDILSSVCVFHHCPVSDFFVAECR